MPAGTVETLRQRYADTVLPSDYREGSEGNASDTQGQNQAGDDAAPAAPPDTPAASSESDNASTPEIPEQCRGSIVELQYTGENTPAYIGWRNIWLRNYTKLSAAEVQSVLKKDNSVRAESGTAPQALIYHTHATESFEPYDSAVFDTRHTWRDSDNSRNMVAVGDVLAKGLEKSGIATCHDATQHDNPTYTGAYERSAATIKSYLKKYPSIRVLLDVHRDAIIYNDSKIAKTTALINGKKAAQLMIIAPCGGSGANVPNWKENLRFAAALTERVEEKYPGLMRPIFFCYRSYNFALSDGALLLEFGTNGNTLEEAEYTAQLIAPILADLLRDG